MKNDEKFRISVVKKMKYIGYWEFDAKNIENVIKKYVGFRKLAEKQGLERYPKPITPSYKVGEVHGFQLFEVENEKQIANMLAYYRPEMKWKLLPIIDVRESIDAYYRTKKWKAAPELAKELDEALKKRKKEVEDRLKSK